MYGLLAAALASSVLAVAVAASPVRSNSPNETLDLSADQWRADLRAFATQIPKRHKNAFHHISSEAFTAEVARLDSAIAGGLDADGIVVGMLRITAMVGDGHTAVHLPTAYRSYPFGLKRFGDDLRVIRTTTGADSALGTKLVAIEDVPIERVASACDSLLAQDENPGLREAEAPGFMTLDGILHGLGIVAKKEQARFTFQNDDGGRITLTLAPPATPAADIRWHITSAQAPLYRTRGREPFFFTWLDESRTVYCSWRNYKELGGHAKELFAFVDAHPVDRLVIDMRLNGGGDFYVGRKNMIEPILKRPGINQKGHLFVIISPITFSAALANAIDFRTKTNATLVGEPIGEKANSYSENDEFELPNSHITLSYSTRFYEFAPGQDVIAPDQAIAPTWEEFRAGRDPVLEWILSCCR